MAGRRIDPVAGHVSQGDERARLGRKQLEVLAMLVSAAGEIVAREAFIQRVWDGDALVGERALNDAMHALRRALDGASKKDSLIRTIPRRGYQLMAEARLLEDEHGLSFCESWPVPGRTGWRLVQPLAHSDVTETWLAEQSSSGARRVFRFCRNEAHLQRLRREITVMRFLREKLADRHDILTIIDWQLDEPPYFLETDYPAHGSLADWLEAQGGVDQVPLAERIRLVAQAASALDAVHAAGVVHRNISPASLFVDRGDDVPSVKLGEFGLGSLADRSQLAAMELSADGLTLTADGSSGGRVYQAPEQESVEAPGDVYALGVVLYQLAVGDLQADLASRGLAAVPGLRLRELVAECVHERPESRPTAQALRRRLETLDSATAEAAPSPGPIWRAAVGESVGPYRLLDVLGQGGMGTVFLAEQREPVQRTVALKLVRAGMDSQQVLARFEAERQALALMDHANVAAVHDAGCSASGHPYFAMEYVPGLELTAHCDRAKHGLRERVELFLQVCDGVQHAHQKGLIHRDLKPSNLLVKSATGHAATVKIIDFGVAKSLQGRLSSHTVHTRLGTFVGTPRYSSPEQISGHQVDVDIRADVYSLGIVLYELLTGVTPYSSEELAGKTPLELVKLLSDSDPPPPSARFTRLTDEDRELIANNRSETVEHLRQRLRSDLAWIIIKCLERDPEDRYPSVLELRKDLVRWLEDRPIEARPATRTYRLRKLVKRHRTAVTLTVLTTLALLATTTMAVFGLVRAEREAAKARAAARRAEIAADFQANQLRAIDTASMALGLRSRLQEEVRQAKVEAGSDASAVEEADRQLERLLEGVNLLDLASDLLGGHFFEPAIEVVAEDYADYPELQAQLWQSIADTLLEVGLYNRALASQELALETRRSVLGADHPLTLESMLLRGRVLSRLGQLQQARVDLEAALAGMRRHFGENDVRTLDAQEALGELLLKLQVWQEARAHLLEVLAARRRVLGDEHPDTLSTIASLAVLEIWHREHERAEAYFNEALAGMRRVLGEQHPSTLAVMAEFSGLYAEKGRQDQAITIMQEAVSGLRATLGDHHPQTASTINKLAILLRDNKDFEGAERCIREALRSQRMFLGAHHLDTMETTANLGKVLSMTGRLAEAEALLSQASDVLSRVLGPTHMRARHFLFRLAWLYRDRGKLDEAESALRQLLSSLAAAGTDPSAALSMTNELANVLQLKGRLGEAERLHVETLEKQKRLDGAQHHRTLHSQSNLAEVWKKQGKLAEAETLFRQTLELQRERPGLRHYTTLLTMSRLAVLLRSQGQPQEALALGEEAVRAAASLFHEDSHHLALLKLGLGQTLRDLGRLQEAEPMLRDAREKLAKAGLDVTGPATLGGA